MAHSVGGFDLKYTSRSSWKAEVRRLGRFVDTAPVTWVKDYHFADRLLDVHFQDAAEAVQYNSRKESFIVALARPKDETKHPPEFREFVRLFKVLATGKMKRPHTIETHVLDGVMAD